MAVIREGERFLVIRRSQSVIAPGMLCFPGGGVEEGESEAEALIREMEEELGARVELLRRVWENTTSWGVDLAWWQAAFRSGHRPAANPEEVASIHWLTAAEMDQLPDLLESAQHFLDAMAAGDVQLGE